MQVSTDVISKFVMQSVHNWPLHCRVDELSMNRVISAQMLMTKWSNAQMVRALKCTCKFEDVSTPFSPFD